MWWLLFGFRAKDESRKLCWGDVELQQHLVQMLVWLNERRTKTQKGRENQRQFQPKLYNLFKSHRPEEMNPEPISHSF